MILLRIPSGILSDSTSSYNGRAVSSTITLARIRRAWRAKNWRGFQLRRAAYHVTTVPEITKNALVDFSDRGASRAHARAPAGDTASSATRIHTHATTLSDGTAQPLKVYGCD